MFHLEIVGGSEKSWYRITLVMQKMFKVVSLGLLTFS